MQFRSFNSEVHIASCLVSNIFNKIVISRFDNKKQVTQNIEVPLVWATRSRALKELENVNKTIKPPILSLTKENFVRDEERMAGIYDYTNTLPDGYTNLSRMRGIPINITFTLSGIAVYDLDIDQILSNFIPFFKPDIFISWKHPKYDGPTLKCPLVWSGDVGYTGPSEFSAADNEFYQFQTSFVFKTWIFAGMEADAEDEPLIKYVNTEDDGMFAIGDAGYGMNSFYVVPKSITMTDFLDNVRNGLVEDTEKGLISVPRLVGLPTSPMNNVYPAVCTRTAASLKLVILSEDRDDPDFNPNLFGFDSKNIPLDLNVWYFKTNLENKEENGRFIYDADSEYSDSNIEIKLSSHFDANFDWVRQTAGPVVAYPIDQAEATGEQWQITQDTSNGTAPLPFSNGAGPWRSNLPASLAYYNKLNEFTVQRYKVAASSERPLNWLLEGYLSDPSGWVTLDGKSDVVWNTNELYFDVFDPRSFKALRLTVTKSEVGGRVAIDSFGAWSQIIGSEGPGSEASVSSSLSFSLEIPGLSDSKIESAAQAVTGADRSTSLSYGNLITDVNDSDSSALEKFDWFGPSQERMLPVFFRPCHYLIFKLKGRTYGAAPGGMIEIPKVQSITHGEVLPIRPADGSLHVLTSGKGMPLLQYDASQRTWFTIGNGQRPPFQRIFPYLEEQDKNLIITRNAGATLLIPELTTTRDTYYLSAIAKSDVNGVCHLAIDAGGTTSEFELPTVRKGNFVQIPFLVDGTVNSVIVRMIPLGTTISRLVLESSNITGKLVEGDFGS